ncbi:MAG TPA: MBL fold metallo-hydrolase [Candidatus Krumholzibacteria bacterium]|nr:MBL fold metallo-hydrolase [Candidatus Krumholzibacteria bacterium]
MSLSITYIGHATCLVEMDGVRVLTDPILRNRVGHIRRHSASVHRDGHRKLDAVAISHLHLDHLDRPSLRRIDRSTRIIVPAGGADILRREGFSRIDEVRAGDSTMVGSIMVDVTRADHDSSRYPFGPEADAVGYLFRGPKSVYFAGDTDIFPEMSEIHGDLDVALLPVWGWGPTLGQGHLNPRSAAESLKMLRPRAAIPIHWGTFAPLGLGWLRPRFLTAPPYDFADHASSLAPGVEVHVVQPGNRFRLGH